MSPSAWGPLLYGGPRLFCLTDPCALRMTLGLSSSYPQLRAHCRQPHNRAFTEKKIFKYFFYFQNYIAKYLYIKIHGLSNSLRLGSSNISLRTVLSEYYLNEFLNCILMNFSVKCLIQ